VVVAASVLNRLGGVRDGTAKPLDLAYTRAIRPAACSNQPAVRARARAWSALCKCAGLVWLVPLPFVDRERGEDRIEHTGSVPPICTAHRSTPPFQIRGVDAFGAAPVGGARSWRDAEQALSVNIGSCVATTPFRKTFT
jgi:hypothetical protein